MDAAHEAGFDGCLGDLTAQAFKQACEQGMADMDDSKMLEFIRQVQQA
jgi:3-hydroxyisobutyrate dehydrogenase-like beta-hydroxyacid dehydrogenase